VRISAVIPTWNEERWLPRLLCRLIDRTEISEIVVADNTSDDSTREVAMGFGCRVVDGGRPAEGRNRGAAATQGDLLLFVDADVVPSEAALGKLALPPSAATVHFKVLPMADDWFIRGCYAAADAWFAALAAARVRHGFTNFVLIDRGTFESVGGFDEQLDPGEDVDFIRRASREASVDYERNTHVVISARRFFAESPKGFAAKTAFWEGLRLAGLRQNPIPYRWSRHDPSIAAREDAWLARNRSALK
jgi:glycosyltransferase involved in cell wall biosynthesis